VKIDPEFQQLIPVPLTEELAQLEENLVSEGCRDPLVVWKEKDILLDGHNRFRICQNRKIKFKTVELSFENREAAKVWLIRNQFGRRNLTPYQRAELALKLKPLIAEKAKERQLGSLKKGNKNPVVQNSAPRSKTRDELATITGVSHDTINKTEKIQAKADEKTKHDLRAGIKTVNSVFREISKKERVEEIKVRSAADEKSVPRDDKLKSLADGAGQFRCVYVDPPWEYNDSTGRGAAEGHYPTMDIKALSKLPIGELAHDDGCHFWIWTTWPKIRDSRIHELINSWNQAN